MVGFLIVAGLVVLLVVRRARRARTLAGLNATRPVFSVEPPPGRLSSRRDKRL